MRKLIAIASIAAAAAACGGSYGDGPAGGPMAQTNAPVFTFGADGVSPKELTVTIDTMVTFTNNSTREIDLASSPHPAHTDCPELNLRELAPGATRTVRIVTRRASCGFHDHDAPSDETVKGTLHVGGF